MGSVLRAGPGLPLAGAGAQPHHIAQTLHAERIDAVMTIGSVTPEDLVTLMRGLENTQVPRRRPGLQDVVPGREGLDRHLWLDRPYRHQTRRTRALGKALFDRLAGAIGWYLLAATVAIASTPPGPVLPRPAWSERSPSPWKFRSCIDSDARRIGGQGWRQHAGNEVMSGDRQTRDTGLIRLLDRRAAQLINVVRGDMSLVGPHFLSRMLARR